MEFYHVFNLKLYLKSSILEENQHSKILTLTKKPKSPWCTRARDLQVTIPNLHSLLKMCNIHCSFKFNSGTNEKDF